jgi:hypothetical protein
MNNGKPFSMTEQRMKTEVQAGKETTNHRYIAPTVEECHAIEVRMFRNRRKQWNSSGELTWVGERTGRVTLKMRYRVIGIPGAESVRNIYENASDGPLVVLTVGGSAQAIRIRTCAGGFGGKRYFLGCPSCERTYRKLFLPTGKIEFSCRRCYGLRYTSQRRDLDFLLKPIAVQTGIKRRLIRQYLDEIRKTTPREAAMLQQKD